MITLHISEELAGTIKEEATIRGVSIEEYLRSAIQRERTLTARQKMEQDQVWWLSLPLSKRVKYEGEFIAVHNQKLIDHDKDDAILYKRVRKKYEKTPVLVMPAEGPKEIRMISPRIVRQ